MKSKPLKISSIFLVILLLTACTGDTHTISSTPKTASTLSPGHTTPTNSISSIEIPESQGKKNTQSDINPLTGMGVSNPSLLNRRPVLVKISNYPAVGRPHAGLAFADLVFDYYIGSGQNRFLALFYGQDANSIGPVRSGRLVDIQLTNLYQGILGFGSADGDTLNEIYKDLGRRAIANLEAPCPAFCGNDTHSVIGVFANSAEISRWYSQQTGDAQRYDLSGMKFGDLDETTAKSGEQVTIQFNYYNRTDWKYDPASHQYLRWMNEELQPETINMIPSTEKTTGKQLGFSNLIILFARYTEFSPSKYDVEIFGNTQGHRAVFFRDGKMVDGTWKVVSRSQPIQFFDNTAKPMLMAAGNSWIVLAGMNSAFQETQTGQWNLFFALP